MIGPWDEQELEALLHQECEVLEAMGRRCSYFTMDIPRSQVLSPTWMWSREGPQPAVLKLERGCQGVADPKDHSWKFLHLCVVGLGLAWKSIPGPLSAILPHFDLLQRRRGTPKE